MNYIGIILIIDSWSKSKTFLNIFNNNDGYVLQNF